MNKSNQPRPQKGRKANKKKRQTRREQVNWGGLKTITPYAKELFCKIQYKDGFNLATAPGIASYVYRLNSLFDPDYTSGTKQPYMYDQLTAVYNRYRVFKTSVKVTAIGASSSYSQMIVLSANGVTTNFTNIFNAAASSYSVDSIVTTASSGTCKTIFSQEYNIIQVLGYDENVDQDLSAIYTADPYQGCYLHISHDTMPIGNTTSVNYLVELVFHCKFYELRVQADS